MKIGFLLLFSCMLLFSSDSSWKTFDLIREIGVDQKISSVPNGYSVLSGESRFRLKSVNICAGDIKGGVLAPSGEFFDKKSKNGHDYYNVKEMNKDGIWIVCYFYNTNIGIYKKMPDNVSEINVYFSSVNPDYPKFEKIEYR